MEVGLPHNFHFRILSEELFNQLLLLERTFLFKRKVEDERRRNILPLFLLLVKANLKFMKFRLGGGNKAASHLDSLAFLGELKLFPSSRCIENCFIVFVLHNIFHFSSMCRGKLPLSCCDTRRKQRASKCN